MAACRARTRRTALLAHGLTSVHRELRKATDGERWAKIGMSVNTRQEQDSKKGKVWPEIVRKLTKFITFDCVTTLCH